MSDRKIIFLGPPGSGKGTQAERLANHLQLLRIAPGDILRNEVRAGTDLGKLAESYMVKGVLVPDNVIMEMVSLHLKKDVFRNGFVLDGIPRTLVQAKKLDEFVAIDVVILMQVEQEEIVKRLSGRRFCASCDANYQIYFNPPKIKGRCDRCGAELQIRRDDTQEVVKTRLSTYQEWTAPLVEYYRKRSVLKEINGQGQVDTVFERVKKLFEPNV